MPRKIIPPFTVIRDTREKDGYGWTFAEQKQNVRSPRCDGTIIKKLDIGDYTLKGYEDILSIERKDSLGELWVNHVEDRAGFEEKMSIMSSLKYKFLLVETSLVPDHFDLSPCQIRNGAPGKMIVQWLSDIAIKYNIHIAYVGQCGSKYARSIFKSVVRLEKDRWILKST